VSYTHKFDVNNKTIRTDLKFSVSLVAIATVAILTIGSTTAHADTGFNNGYAKGKFDITAVNQYAYHLN
jgi:hypothetical protein